jgi:type IV pilus assembly protein PilM
LGLDIGSHTVKAIQLASEKHSQFRLLSLGVAEIDKGTENQPESIPAAVTQALGDCDVGKVRLITSLGGSSAVIKQVSFPLVSEKEIESSLKWEASRHIPMSLDSVELSFQVRTVNKEENSSEVLLVAADKGVLRQHLDLLDEVRLRPDIVDVSPLALANAFLTLTSEDEEKNIALIDMGASSTVITIFRRGGFFFARDISVGGDRLTKEIQDIYRLEYPQAERFKKEEDVDLEHMKPVLDQMLFEIRQSLLFYDNKTGHKGYEDFVLTGGGAKLPGLSAYLEENLNLPINSFKPLTDIEIDGSVSEDAVKEVESQLGVAVGLALRK